MKRSKKTGGIIMIAALVAAGSAQASTVVWDGTAGDGLWTNTNWTIDGGPAGSAVPTDNTPTDIDCGYVGHVWSIYGATISQVVQIQLSGGSLDIQNSTVSLLPSSNLTTRSLSGLNIGQNSAVTATIANSTLNLGRSNNAGTAFRVLNGSSLATTDTTINAAGEALSDIEIDGAGSWTMVHTVVTLTRDFDVKSAGTELSVDAGSSLTIGGSLDVLNEQAHIVFDGGSLTTDWIRLNSNDNTGNYEMFTFLGGEITLRDSNPLKDANGFEGGFNWTATPGAGTITHTNATEAGNELASKVDQGFFSIDGTRINPVLAFDGSNLAALNAELATLAVNDKYFRITAVAPATQILEVVATAAVTDFTNGSGDGTWANDLNWNNGVPSAIKDATVNGGLTANLAGTTQSALKFSVGSVDGENGTVNNGSLTIGGDTEIGTGANSVGMVDVATYTAPANAIMTIASGEGASGELTAVNGTVDAFTLSIASGSNSVGTLDIATGSVTVDGLVNIATGQGSTASVAPGSGIMLNSTNGLFVGTGAGSSHNLAVGDFSITGPIGDFGVGDGTGSIKDLISLHDSYGSLLVDSALNITGNDHQISDIVVNAPLTFGGTATRSLISGGQIGVASLAGVNAALDLGDLVTGDHTAGAIGLALGDHATGSLTYTAGALNITANMDVGNGAGADGSVLLKSLSSVATNNALRIADADGGGTGTVTVVEDVVVRDLRMATGTDTVGTLTVDALYVARYFIVGLASNGTATVSATTLDRPGSYGLQIAQGKDSHVKVTASHGTVVAGGSNGANIAAGVNSEGIFVLTNGTLTVAQDANFNVATGSNSTAVVYAAVINVPGTNDVNIASGADSDAAVKTLGGTITAANLNLGRGGVLTLAGGNLVVTGVAAIGTGGYIDVTEAASEVQLVGQTEAGYIALWTAGALRSKGKSGLTAAAFSDYFTVAGDVLSAVARYPIGDIVMDGPLAGGGMTLSWNSNDGQIYVVEINGNLVYGTWQSLGSSITGTGGELTVTTAVDQAASFYRVISE